MQDKNDQVWISICSQHINKNYDCSACKTGHWVSQKELDEEHELFTNNYPEWYKRHNNGKEPHESALETWRLITEKKRNEN